MNLGQFLNGFVRDSQTFWTAAIGSVVFLCIFGYFYNKWMDQLGEEKEGYTAFLVAIGNLITLAVGAVLSWKAAILLLVLYIADGVFMIVGDIVRARKAAKAKKWVRRKPLPYAAAGLVDDAIMANTEAQRALKALITKNGADALQQAALASLEIGIAIQKLTEVKGIEGD